MTDIAFLEAALLVLFIGTLIWCTVEDVRRRVIPHSATAAVVGLYIVYAAAGYSDPLSGIAAGALYLLIGFVLFQLNLLGGGDAKLIAAVALWAGLDGALPLAFYVTMAGGVVALGVLITHRIRVHADGSAKNTVATVPYGMAIAVGGSFVALGGV
ncbi:MAG: prepilin peptidase [Alphaproteobacteria bacterium]